jgi:hypothetical protein
MGPFASLRPFLRPKTAGTSRCELCGASMDEHAHLVELKTRKVVCSCEPCAILFGSQGAAHYRRIPRDVRSLEDFVLTDAQWEALAIPINMAYFCLTGSSNSPTVFYPSPAGATESLLAVDSWQEIVADNPAVRCMQPDVECLLVNRVASPYRYFLTPIDECYRLVGLIRSNWRGFSGGTEVWKKIGAFFVSLEKRSAASGKMHYARS